MPPAYRAAGGLPFRPRKSPEFRGIDLSTETVKPDPYPEMGREIATRHLWLVESATYFHGTDADAISAAVVLPRWNVRRALHALGLGTVPDASPKFDRTAARSSPKASAAAAWLSARGKPATAAEVADAVGINDPADAAKLLNRNPDRFRRAGETRAGKARFILWEAA